MIKNLDVKKLRKQLNLTQDEFAVKLGIAPYTVRRWESGATSPSRLAQKAIKEVFGNHHQSTPNQNLATLWDWLVDWVKGLFGKGK